MEIQNLTCVDSNRRPNDHCSAKPLSFDNITSEIRGFKIALLNVTSLTKHVDELKVFMSNTPLDVLTINESKLDLVNGDRLVNLEGYNIVRRDRNKHGGGVCFYLRNTITFSRQYQLENDDLELIALEIQKPNSCPFLIATWYRPPNTPLDYFKKFEMFLKEADARYSEIYILGDLNCNILSNPPEVHTTHLLDLMVDYQLAQLIKEPTRVNAKSQTLIDVFITNKEDNISHSGVYTLSISDHNLIYAVRKIGLPRGQPKFIQLRNFKHFNENNFLTDLKNASWPVIKSGMEVNSAWNAWKDIFLNIVDKHAPRRVMRVRNKPAPWLNSQLKEEMYERDWLKKKASETQRPDVWKAYKTKKLTVNKKVKKTKKDYHKH